MFQPFKAHTIPMNAKKKRIRDDSYLEIRQDKALETPLKAFVI